MIDILSYGKHSPLGNTLDVPEERDPGNYKGKHRNIRAVGAPEDWPFGYLVCGCRNNGYGGHVR